MKDTAQARKPGHVAGIPCLRNVAPAVLTRLKQSARARPFPRGTVLVRQGVIFDQVLLVAEGRVKLYSVGDGGHHQTVHILGEGDCFCLAPAHQSIPSPVSAECLQDSRLILLSREIIGDLVEREPSITNGVIHCLACRLSSATERLGSSRHLSVRERLSGILLDLTTRHGRLSDDGLILEGLTQDELAACTGSAREVVSRALGRLQREGVLRTGRGRVVILDQARLKAMARRLKSGTAL